MPFLWVSPGRRAARVAEVLVRGLAVVLGMFALVAFFIPLVPALPLWPVLRWQRVRWILTAFLQAAGTVAELGRPDTPPVRRRSADRVPPRR